MSAFGIDATAKYLDQNHVPYEVVEHRITYTAAAEARAAGIPTDGVAKTVVLHADDGYRLAVIPASERLDMSKARKAFGNIRMASEEEMQKDLRNFELGAVPPFGTLIDAPETIDPRLLEHEKVLCNGGDHSHSLLLNPQDIVKVAHPSVWDLCQD